MTVRILYGNQFELAPTIVASSEDTANNGFKENAFDGNPRDWWKPTAGGAQSLYYDLGVGNSAAIDAFGLYSSDLKGGQIAVQHSPDASVWTDAISAFTPATPVVFKSFASATKRAGKIALTGSASAAAIGCVAIGKMLEYSSGANVGFAPILGQPAKGVAAETSDGYPVASDSVMVAADGKLTFNLLDPAVVRSDWMPFWEHAKLGKPFWLSWDETNYPNEAAFCRCNPADVKPLPYSHTRFMKYEMPFKALVVN